MNIKNTIPLLVTFLLSSFGTHAAQYVETFKLVTTVQHKCLDVAGYSGANNKNVQIYNCDGYDDQRWYLTTTAHVPVSLNQSSGGSFYLKNAKSGLCLDIAGGWAQPDDTARMSICNGAQDQQFSAHVPGSYDPFRPSLSLTPWNNGDILITVLAVSNGTSGHCLDVAGTTGNSGNDVQLWECLGPWSPNYQDQVWNVEDVYYMNVP